MSASASLATKAQALASKSVKIEYQENKVPTVSSNFVDLFKAGSATRTDFANVFTIDVLPNFVPIFCYLAYHVNLISGNMETRQHAKISPGTIMAYLFAVIYARFFWCDLKLRHKPSEFAAQWSNDNRKMQFAEYLLTLPVPEFLADIINYFTPTTTEHRANVQWTPSFAGFDSHHHFGRLFPINLFTTLHDVTAEMPANSTKAAVYQALFDSDLFTVTGFSTRRPNFAIRAGNILGYGLPDDHDRGTYYNSKLFQCFTALFNPVLFRDYQRRMTLATIGLHPPTFPNNSYNPYDMIFCWSPTNAAELRTVFESMAPVIKDSVQCKGDLASYFSTLSGTSITMHGYSKYAIPTWIADETIIDETLLVTPSAFAGQLHFLQQPAPTYDQNQQYPTVSCATDASHTLVCRTDPTHQIDRHGFTWPWILLMNQARDTHQNPDPTTQFEVFDEAAHVYPQVYVLTPAENNSTNAWMSTCFGMVIESYELDGTTVPVPNVDLSLGIDNTMFADSAIPYRFIYRATRFSIDAAVERMHPRRRVLPPRQTRMAASSLLVDRTVINLPRPRLTTADNPIVNTLPGLTNLESVTWFKPILSFFGFRTADNRSHATNDDAPPGVPEGRINIWSPYTYTSYEDQNYLSPNRANDRKYMLSNLRTIFGTDTPLVQVKHGLEAMPVF